METVKIILKQSRHKELEIKILHFRDELPQKRFIPLYSNYYTLILTVHKEQSFLQIKNIHLDLQLSVVLV